MSTVDFLGALGAGSDIDSSHWSSIGVSGARPQRASLNAKVDKAELKISARTGPVIAQFLSTAFTALNDAEDFNDYTLNVNGALAQTAVPRSGRRDRCLCRSDRAL